ncbi:hypothetical protein [Paracoccus pacificus]|uniref:Uncharacterized protein n=1 Tax=Paracoccus pacificus TaxID=1463598 RepID=A0ABW4R8H8_9RHOB
MRDWLRRYQIDRRFVIWIVILLLIFPILLGLVIFAGNDLSSDGSGQLFGYALTTFIVAALLSLLYMGAVGLPIILVIWVAVIAALRPTRFSARQRAIMAAVAASLAATVPAALRIGRGSVGTTLGAAAFLGAVPCLVSAIYFLRVYRDTA